LKELKVLGIGSGPPSLDIMDAQFIQLLGNPYLVLHGEGDILCLGSISKGGIVNLNRVWRTQRISPVDAPFILLDGSSFPFF
jgi:hypothetical protein